jgi:tetratricopeptide (TPR) repeat protein
MNSIKRQIGKAGLYFFFMFVFFPGFGQDSVKASLKSQAGEYYLQKDYSNALPLYRELLSFYPKDPDYQYRTALCLLNLNREIEEVINLLRSASADRENPMATFYLGRAYHLHYDFDDAVTAYSRFLTLGKKADIRRLEVQRLIEMAKNGSDLTRKAKSITVKSSGIATVSQLENAYFIGTSGKVIRKPAEFNSKMDQKMNFSSLMVLPAYTEVNDYIYVSGYDETAKKGKEIFRIRKIDNQNWSLPEPLNVNINTPWDEDYPYYDIRSSTLYFSSEGHSGMGGLDIFKSVYDGNTKKWSNPENIGFPINSPYDDYMLVMNDPGQSAQFASNRSTGPGMVMLYRIGLNENQTGTQLLTPEEIREMSALHVTAEAAADSGTIPTGMEVTPSNTDTVTAAATPVPFNKNEYNLLIAEALQLQLKADSLARMARDQRILAKEIPDEEARKQMITDIVNYEREGKRIQLLADERFLKAQKVKARNEPPSQPEANLVKRKEVNGITVYQYKVQDTAVYPIKGTSVPVPAVEKNDKSADQPVREKIDAPAPAQNSETALIPSLPEGITGLVYRIQLGVFSKPRENDAFSGLKPVYAERIPEKNVYKYYTGDFPSLESVTAALEKVRNNGFPDAFVVAFYNAKPITTEKAREIEFAGLKL